CGAGRAKRGFRRRLERVAVDAGRDRGKRDPAAAMRGGQLYRAAIAGCERLLLTRFAAAPDRPYRVNDVLEVPQASGARDLRFAGRAAAVETTLVEDLGPGGAMNGAIHAASSHQARVCGVDNRVSIQ